MSLRTGIRRCDRDQGQGPGEVGPAAGGSGEAPPRRGHLRADTWGLLSPGTQQRGSSDSEWTPHVLPASAAPCLSRLRVSEHRCVSSGRGPRPRPGVCARRRLWGHPAPTWSHMKRRKETGRRAGAFLLLRVTCHSGAHRWAPASEMRAVAVTVQQSGGMCGADGEEGAV